MLWTFPEGAKEKTGKKDAQDIPPLALDQSMVAAMKLTDVLHRRGTGGGRSFRWGLTLAKHSSPQPAIAGAPSQVIPFSSPHLEKPVFLDLNMPLEMQAQAHCSDTVSLS